MKKIHIVLAGFVGMGIMVGSVAAVGANSTTPPRPAWVSADGRADFNKMPDTVMVPYQCWNGKTVMLEGKTIKQKESDGTLPGSEEYKRGRAKVEELRTIPGVVTRSKEGAEVITIDDNNPEIQRIMQKYEAQETPQCR